MSYVDTIFGLEGKVAVITGGGGVLAGALAEALGGAGAALSLWSRGKSVAVKESADKIALRLKRKVHSVTLDTADKKAVQTALDTTVRELGRVDILINGVGGNLGRSSLVDADLAVFQEVLKLNLLAGFMVPTQVLASYWMQEGIKGSVINIASMASYIPLSGIWGYDAAKSALLNLTMAAAKEFAAQGIRVNALAPGFFVGKQNKALLFDEKGELTGRGKAILDHTPYGRFGRAEELAGAALFLASDRASGFVSGVSIPVDGGYLVDNI